ncbi:MAG TPA: hypothetical protein VL220_09045 [Steroidobacteraceae bacterium]|nr:hypothetical protein [Steroidobacteraceae bacterium]
MRYSSCVSLCLLLLSACAGQAVEDAGVGRHSLTASSSHGVLAARDRAEQLANRYCAKSGQRAAVESYEDKTLGGAVGDPTSSVVFTCAAPNTTALIR